MSNIDPWARTNTPAAGSPDFPFDPRWGVPVPPIQKARTRISTWLAASFFAAVFVLNVIWLFQPVYQGDPSYLEASGPLYEFDFPGITAENGSFLLAGGACAVLLAFSRTRGFATGFGIGFAGLWFATVFLGLRVPHGNAEATGLSEWCVAASQALALPALVFLLWSVRRQGKSAPPQAAVPQTAVPSASARRLPAGRGSVLALGLIAAVAWGVGEALAWVAIVGPTGLPNAPDAGVRTTCCSFNQNNGFGKADMICGAVAFVALAVLAAAGRNATRSTGILYGMLIVPLGQLVIMVFQVCFPLEYEFSLQNQILHGPLPINSDVVDNYSPVLGFWVALAAFFILIAAATTLAVLARRGKRLPGMYLVPAQYNAMPPGGAVSAPPPQQAPMAQAAVSTASADQAASSDPAVASDPAGSANPVESAGSTGSAESGLQR